MPPRKTPTERQKRLGAELRKMRTAAGVTTDYAAGLLGLDRGKITNIEAGVRIITPERLKTLACNYACADEQYIEALAAMADNHERGWWERFRGTLPMGMLDIAELEWHAVQVLTSQVVHVPGLLQTEEYAREIFRVGLPPMPPLEVELHVAHRMQRQQVLERDKPLDYVGFVHEAALRMQFGGRAAARRQLTHLLLATERDNVAVRVLPVERGIFPGSGHALLYAKESVPQLSTAQLDSADGPIFVHAEFQLARYRAHLEWMGSATLDAKETRDFIRCITREL